MAMPAFSSGYTVTDPMLLPLAEFLEEHAEDVVRRAERAWESTILLYAQLSERQRQRIRRLARETLRVWAGRLRQDPAYPRRVFDLGRQWGEQAAGWELHVYSFTKAITLLASATWEYLAEAYPQEKMSPATIFVLGKTRDQVTDDLQIPLLSTYLQQREVETAQARFSLQGPLSLPGRSLLQELGNRLRDNLERVVPAWIDRVRSAPGATEAIVQLLDRRSTALVALLLTLLQSPTPETGAASLTSVRTIGMESAQAGVSFQEMFHALQQVRPILWDTVYEIYRREQYWHPAEFIEVLARLHLLLDLFSEGIGQAYLQQKEMIIQHQAEEIRRRDLKLARDLLRGLLPKTTIQLPNTDIGTAWMPAAEIGGDFYDIFLLPDGDAVFLIGDVSGKGISAALLVSMVKYAIKANAPTQRSPAQLLSVVNKLLYQDLGPELFVTLFLARYSPATGHLVYTSAGHDTCYLCRSGPHQRIMKMPSQGPLLGVFEDVELLDRRTQMCAEDILLLYTDGLVNVRCEGNHPIDSRSLCRSMRKHREMPAQEMLQALLDSTLTRCEPTDDITVMVIKRKEEPHG